MSLEWWVIFFWRGIKDHNWIFFRAAQTFSDSQPTIILMNVSWLERELVDKGPPLQVPACNFKSDNSAPIEKHRKNRAMTTVFKGIDGICIHYFMKEGQFDLVPTFGFFLYIFWGKDKRKKHSKWCLLSNTLRELLFSELLNIRSPDSVHLDTSVLWSFWLAALRFVTFTLCSYSACHCHNSIAAPLPAAPWWCLFIFSLSALYKCFIFQCVLYVKSYCSWLIGWNRPSPDH